MATKTLEKKANERFSLAGKSNGEMIKCTFYPDDKCGKIFPKRLAHYQGSVAMCPDCYDRWFYLQED